jgi:hypothetical protein
LNILKDIQRLEDIHGVCILQYRCIYNVSYMLEFLNNLWGLGNEYRNKVVVPARQATWAGGIDALESVGFLKV